MSNLDLSSENVAAWLDVLPVDLRHAVPDEQVSVGDEQMEILADEISKSGPKRMASVIHRHGDLLSTVGRARRLIILAWVANETHPNSSPVIAAISTEADDEDEGGGVVGDGRKKVAPYFRQDVEAIAAVTRSRVARSFAHKKTLMAIAGGIDDFQEQDVMQQQFGRM